MAFNPKEALNRIRLQKSTPQPPPPPALNTSAFSQQNQFIPEYQLPSFNRSIVFEREKLTESILFGNKFSDYSDSSRDPTPSTSKECELKSRVLDLEKVVQQLQSQLNDEKEHSFHIRREKSHLETELIKLNFENKELKHNKSGTKENKSKSINKPIKQPLKCSPQPKEAKIGGGKKKVSSVCIQNLTRNLNQLTYIFENYPELERPLIKITNFKESLN